MRPGILQLLQLLDAIKHRNKLLKKAKRTKTDEDWRLYKISRNTTYYKIRSSKANFFKAAINDNVNNPRIYWDHLNTLIKGKNVHALMKASRARLVFRN